MDPPHPDQDLSALKAFKSKSSSEDEELLLSEVRLITVNVPNFEHIPYFERIETNQ